MYEGPITLGQDKDATPRQREVGAAVAAELRRVIAPYFLRREKHQVLGGGTSAGTSGAPAGGTGAGPPAEVAGAGATVQQQGPGAGPSRGSSSSSSSAAQPQALGRKNDFVVWLQLRPLQQVGPPRGVRETQAPGV